jgi:hypothetical protein
MLYDGVMDTYNFWATNSFWKSVSPKASSPDFALR